MTETVERTAGLSERRRRIRTVLAIAATGLLCVLAVGLRFFWIEAFKIPSAGMSPALVPGDHIFVRKTAYGWIDHGAPSRGDVIVFRFPERPNQDFVQRVIGLPGDRISLKGGAVHINGWRVPSCSAGKVTMADREQVHEGQLVMEFLGDAAYLVFHDELLDGVRPHDEQGPYEVAPDQIFVMGDNRENSYDSRMWFEGRGGGVPLGHVKGRASIIWMSFDPRGAIASSRIGTSLTDPPTCPEQFPSETCAAIARCLAQRPPTSATTPPSRGQPAP